MDDNKFAGLTNTEICMIYHRFKDSKKTLDRHLDKNIIPVFGDKTIEVPEGVIRKFKDGDFYKTIAKIVTKLEPIVELIGEVEPEAANKYV